MEEIEVTVHELQGSPPPVRSERRSELQADSSVSTPFAVSGSGLLKIDLPPRFKGDGTESFSSWARRFEVAVEAMTAPDKDYSAVMSSVLPTRLTDAAFLFWDSLPPATKKDYHSVKEKLEKVFGPKYSLPFFQTHVNARPRQPGESLDVYSADITRLVLEAFPKYDRHALEGEKFRRFVAGLDPALQAKIHEQGAEDIEGALRIASRCERARVALQLNSTEHMHKAASVEQVAMVRPRPSEDQLLQAVEQLTLTVDNLRHEVHQLHVKHRHLADNFSPVSTPSSRFYYERDSTPEPYRSPRPRGYYSPERYGRDSVRVRKPSPPAHQEYRERDTERRDRYAVTNRYSRYDQPEYSRSDFGQRRSPSPAPRGRRDASPRPRPSVSEDFRNSHPALKKRPMTASTVPARSVNGQCLDILGTLTIGLRLGQKVWQQEVEVLRGAYQPVILGWDFLVQHHALLDAKNKVLQLWDLTMPLLPKQHEVAACCNVSVLAPTKIPAMSETLITACVSSATPASPVPTDYCGVVMPNTNCDVMVAHSVSSVQNGTTIVRVLNPSRDDIELHPGQHLGEFHSASSVDIMPIGDTSAVTVDKDFIPIAKLPNTNLSHAQIESLNNLLQKYSDVFSANSQDRGRTGLIKHHIRTGVALPIKQRAYRVTPDQRAEIQAQVDELLKADIIEESYSPWAAPVVLVRKKNGTWRFILDYRKLNSVTIKDSHPLPRVDDALDALSGSAWFSTMDLQHGYWQVELEDCDREKTAFTTGSGRYHFKVMPMGLTNAPATCQRLMEMVLRGLPWKTCLVYLDDVLIYSRTFDEHLAHLEEVFCRLQTSGLKLNPSKCSFAQQQVQFLGHIVSGQGVQPDPRNVSSVQNWPIPRTATEPGDCATLWRLCCVGCLKVRGAPPSRLCLCPFDHYLAWRFSVGPALDLSCSASK
ncbi:hypothetical protein WMY93_008344 [Mugilogobius chulae]|uniref:ribonuclease H n=1 Tax=Mugilogobius chulae TaxID=88201 RepID=A0AAW0PM34_9GOBI